MARSYHALNVVPFSIQQLGLENAFIVGGGYKYCQLGEGNCFLRFPKDCHLRPVITGWFAEFETMNFKDRQISTPYSNGNNRFAGATYDPVSHYRAGNVFDFFDKHQLTPEFLRVISQHQIGLLRNRFDEAELDPHIIKHDGSRLETIAGFLALQTPYSEKFSKRLKESGVFTDYRGNILRLGPAPYLSDQQLEIAMEHLIGIVKESHVESSLP